MPCESTRLLLELRDKYEHLQRTCGRLRSRNQMLTRTRDDVGMLRVYSDVNASLEREVTRVSRQRTEWARRCVHQIEARCHAQLELRRVADMMTRQRERLLDEMNRVLLRSISIEARPETRATLDQLRLYQTQVYQMITHRFVKPQPVCGICRCTPPWTRALTLLACGHWYCTACWSTWATTRRRRDAEPNCPLCRTSVSEMPTPLGFFRVQSSTSDASLVTPQAESQSLIDE